MRENFRQATAWLFSIEAYIMFGLTGVGMVLPKLLALPVGVGVLFMLLRKVVWGKITRPTPLDVCVWIMGVMGLVSFGISPLKDISTVQVFRLLCGLMLFWGLVNGLRGKRGVDLFIWAFLAAGVMLVISSPFTVNWVVNPITSVFNQIRERVGFSMADTIHPNVLAGTLVLLFPLPFAELLFGWREHGWVYRIVMIGLCILFISTMVIAQSRGAVLAVGVVMVIFVLVRWKWSWLGVLVGGAIMTGIIMRVGVNELVGFLASSPGLGGIEERVELWSRAIYMIQDFPFTGVGIGLYNPVADTLYPFFLMAPGQISHAHNLFLQIAVDVGLPGLVAWIASLLITSWMGWRVIQSGKQSGDQWQYAKGMGILGINLGLAMHGMLDSVVWGMVRPAPLVWGLWGIATVIFLLSNDLQSLSRSEV